MNNYLATTLNILEKDFNTYFNDDDKKFSHNLATGEVQIDLPLFIKKTLTVEEKLIRYVNPQGIPLLRNNYLNFLSYELEPNSNLLSDENVLITNGGKEAAWLTFLASCSKGETILLPKPGWAPYYIWSKSMGLNIRTYSVLSDNIFSEIYSITKRENIDTIVLNFPNNPTGIDIDSNTFNKIIYLAIEQKIKIISDEVYKFANTNFNSILSLGLDLNEHNLYCIDSVSKFLGLAGLRIGFLIGNKSIIKKLTRFRGSYASCVSSLSQFYVAQLLGSKETDLWVRNLSKQLSHNNKLIAYNLEKKGFDVMSSGGFYIWLKGKEKNMNSINVNGINFKVTNGSVFGDNQYFRICTARDKSIIKVLMA